MVYYDLAHQIRCAKHTFSGRCDITPMVCCSFGGHSTPQFLQCSITFGVIGMNMSNQNWRGKMLNEQLIQLFSWTIKINQCLILLNMCSIFLSLLPDRASSSLGVTR